MKARIERLVGWVLRTFATLIERLVAVGFIYTGVVLAAQTFMALLPLLIALLALLPDDLAAAVSGTLRSRVGLTGGSEAAVGQLVAGKAGISGGVTVFGVLVVLASATSFTRALQRMYELSWGLPRMGLRGTLRGIGWLVGLAAYLALIGGAVRLAGGGTRGTMIKDAVVIVGAVAMWWLTPYVLLLGRVRLRALLPCGLLTATAMLVLGWLSAVIVPRTVRSNERQFGPIGVVFAIQSWLVVVCCTIVAVAVAGAVAAQTDGPLGRLARGPSGWRRDRPGRRRFHKRLTSVTGGG